MNLVTTSQIGSVLTITLNKKARHNCLDDVFLTALFDAIMEAQDPSIHLAIIKSSGTSFSTGGDIAGFLAHTHNLTELKAYAERVVGTLNTVILSILQLAKPVITVVNGAVTGGSLGLVLAADCSVMAEEAFLQPYYGSVGFAPDGGWTALLPEKIGTNATQEIILQNRRVHGAEAKSLGIVTTTCPHAKLNATLETVSQQLLAQNFNTLVATKKLIWNDQKLTTIKTALTAEKDAFIDLICKPDCQEKMARFNSKISSGRAS